MDWDIWTTTTTTIFHWIGPQGFQYQIDQSIDPRWWWWSDGQLPFYFLFCFCYSFILQEYTPCELASLVFFFLQNSGFSPLTNESILPCMCILCYSDDDDDGCIRNGCGWFNLASLFIGLLLLLLYMVYMCGVSS